MFGVVINNEFLGTLIELAFIEEYDLIEIKTHQMANSQVQLPLIYVIGERLLNTLPQTWKINLLTLRILLVQLWIGNTHSSCTDRLDLNKRFLGGNTSISMSGDKESLQRTERNLLIDQIAAITEGAHFRKVAILEQMLTLSAFPVSPQLPHISKTLLPLVVNVVTFVKDVQKLHTVLLRRLEIGVLRLSARLNPQVGPSGAPACLSHLRGVNNVLSTCTRLVRLPHHVLLDITKEN